MLTSFADGRAEALAYPELSGKRVLITGLEAGHGVDIARAFAAVGCRLVLQTPVISPELDVVLEILAQEAPEVRVSSAPITSEDAALVFAQQAVAAYGGLDIVVNLARLEVGEMAGRGSEDDIEGSVAATLGRPLKVTEVVANRMQLTWKEGLILNIVTQAGPPHPVKDMLGKIARGTLAAVTRRQAERWADKAVRINAIVPAGNTLAEDSGLPARLNSEPEIAAIALHLAGNGGKSVSGLVFDAGLARG